MRGKKTKQNMGDGESTTTATDSPEGRLLREQGENQGNDIPHALAVPNRGVVDRIGAEYVEQRALAHPTGIPEQLVLGKGAPNVAANRLLD